MLCNTKRARLPSVEDLKPQRLRGRSLANVRLCNFLPALSSRECQCRASSSGSPSTFEGRPLCAVLGHTPNQCGALWRSAGRRLCFVDEGVERARGFDCHIFVAILDGGEPPAANHPTLSLRYISAAHGWTQQLLRRPRGARPTTSRGADKPCPLSRFRKQRPVRTPHLEDTRTRTP